VGTNSIRATADKNIQFLDELRSVAAEVGHTVAQVVVNWTIWQPGITSALCGAKRAEQIRETAEAMLWKLTPEQMDRIDTAIIHRGAIVSRTAV
jgi:aryl-alcohol dehydrogenase-like predicted oxidoreductase